MTSGTALSHETPACTCSDLNWHDECTSCMSERRGETLPVHKFEFFDDRFSCPNCQAGLPHTEFPQTCDECGFEVEVFLTREDAVEAIRVFEEDSDAITTPPSHVYGLGWVVGHTRLLLI